MHEKEMLAWKETWVERDSQTRNKIIIITIIIITTIVWTMKIVMWCKMKKWDNKKIAVTIPTKILLLLNDLINKKTI